MLTIPYLTVNNSYKPLTYTHSYNQDYPTSHPTSHHIPRSPTSQKQWHYSYYDRQEHGMGISTHLIWHSTDYKWHFSDTSMYKLINNFDIPKTTNDSYTLLRKLKLRFYKVITVPDNQHLLEPTTHKIQRPYMKLLPKVHKLNNPASPANLNLLTAHSWITSNPSRLLGTELDSIILWLKNLFKERNILFPLIYNSTDLLNLLDNLWLLSREV